jgi:hypothetical protein
MKGLEREGTDGNLEREKRLGKTLHPTLSWWKLQAEFVAR